MLMNKAKKSGFSPRKCKTRGKASSKLLIPISIMFIGILIMIIVPIFANLGA